jgi:hypothetical protein
MAGTAYHIPGTNDPKKTVCGRPIEVAGRPQVLLTTNAEKKKGTVCGRCKALKTGQARTEKIAAKHRKIREAGEKTSGEKKERKPGNRQPALAILGERCPKELMVTFKGKEYTATINEDFTIAVGGNTFNSPSRAGKDVTGREIDGWTFWSVRLGSGALVKLDALRKEVA